MSYLNNSKPISKKDAMNYHVLSQTALEKITSIINSKLQGFQGEVVTIDWKELGITEMKHAKQIAELYINEGWTVRVESQNQRNEGEYIQFS